MIVRLPNKTATPGTPPAPRYSPSWSRPLSTALSRRGRMQHQKAEGRDASQPFASALTVEGQSPFWLVFFITFRASMKAGGLLMLSARKAEQMTPLLSVAYQQRLADGDQTRAAELLGEPLHKCLAAPIRGPGPTTDYTDFTDEDPAHPWNPVRQEQA
jgi:hypothetical protein